MDPQKRKTSSINFCHSTRFFILGLSTMILTLIVCNSVALNFTIICMAKEEIVTDDANTTTIYRYDYTPLERAWLFSIIPVGNIVGTLTLPYLMSRSEMRIIMTINGLISTLATILTPSSAYLGYMPLLFMRFLQGFATCMCFSSMGSITSQWSGIVESGFFLAFLSTHFQIANSFTMPIAGALCESSWGWPSLYYLLGALSAIGSIGFYIFYKDDPYWHGFVSEKELLKIEEGKISVAARDPNNKKNKKNAPKHVPYKEIFSDFVVWGTVLGNTFIRFGFLLFVQFGPVYLNTVIKLDIKKTGIGAALPYIGSIFLKIAAGQVSDRVTCIPMKLNLKIFVTIASLFLVAGNLSVAFLTADHAILAQLAFIIVVSFSGLSFVGTMKSAQLISRHYSHIIMVFITILSSCVSLILPMVVAIFAPDNTQSQWRFIFIGISIVIFIGMVMFLAIAEVEPRPWVQNTSQKTSRVLTLPTNVVSVIAIPDFEEKKKIDIS